MRKKIFLSIITITTIYASEIQLAPIGVESTQITDVAQNAQTSADVAQALSSTVPGIDISRRSGIANDVLIRGQKRDNISVTVDGTKVCGACPNRMDPPISHVLASQIQSIDITEGPYDVEDFGVLSGGLKIHTKQPTKKKKAQLHLGFGSFNYRKFGVSASGGNDLIRFIITGSEQSSDQYHDGNSDSLAQQTKKKSPVGNHYKTKDEDMQAYRKQSINTKAFIVLTDTNELQLSYTGNRSQNVMYPNTSMDAVKDDSDIYSIAYNIKNISPIYKKIHLEYYYSRVDHPMSTQYRNISTIDSRQDTTNHMKSSIAGVKIKNSITLEKYKILLGVDTSRRVWSGAYSNTTTGMFKGYSINSTVTNNVALFAKIEKSYNDFDFTIGSRYDATHITNGGNLQSNDYHSLGANILLNYNINRENKIFIGLGQASRVPDARELYFLKKGNVLGTPKLKQVTNTEVDLGYKVSSEYIDFKIKTFYSKIYNYIYTQQNIAQNIFKNIDANIYGAEISSSIYATDNLSIDMGVAYKRGRKDKALTGQTNKNLADMAPLRGSIALNYEYANHSLATIEVKGSDKWSDYDSDNGEQEIDAWAVLNLKVKHAINKKFDFTIGLNNALNKTYVVSNTYADLTLLGSTTGEKMLLNEPGRYIYTNLDFKF